MCVCVCVLLDQSCLTFCVCVDCSLPGYSVHGFSRQKYWSGLPSPSPGDLPNPGIKPESPALQEASLPLSLLGSPRKTQEHNFYGSFVFTWSFFIGKHHLRVSIAMTYLPSGGKVGLAHQAPLFWIEPQKSACNKRDIFMEPVEECDSILS